jgi:hypothetical protein
MSVRATLIVITALAVFAILHVIGVSLIASTSNRPATEPTYLHGAD